jgi:ectoine hydroxylase-related dioxygenase (phytanoyl-CoA dioxygenase family)
MSFVSGSHHHGALGHFSTYGDGDLLDSFPEILDDCAITEPMTYEAGDVTVHSNLCVHGAGANQTDAPRWAYIMIVNPSDARWTGAPQDAYSTDGLKKYEELDDERFPLVG